MRHLSIDIETYSGIDLKKAGLYRYAQSSDFEIMLLAYAWEDGVPRIIDFLSGGDPKRLIKRHGVKLSMLFNAAR